MPGGRPKKLFFICKGCGKTLAREDVKFTNRGKRGLESTGRCTPCWSTWKRIYNKEYLDNRPAKREAQRARSRRWAGSIGSGLCRPGSFLDKASALADRIVQVFKKLPANRRRRFALIVLRLSCENSKWSTAAKTARVDEYLADYSGI